VIKIKVCNHIRTLQAVILCYANVFDVREKVIWSVHIGFTVRVPVAAYLPVWPTADCTSLMLKSAIGSPSSPQLDM